MDTYSQNPLPKFERTYDVGLNIYTLPGGYFGIGRGVDGVVTDSEKRVVMEPSCFHDPAVLQSLLDAPATRIPGHVFVAVDAACHNYFHLVCYGLAKMKIAERLSPNEFSFVIPDMTGRSIAYSPETFEQALATFDVGRPLTRLPPGLYCADAVSFIWTDPKLPPEILQTTAFKNVFKEIGSRLPLAQSSPKRIFVSRAKASSRRFDADYEDGLRAVLSNHGFETLLLENMSFLEQLAAFKNAEFMVSAHGASFTNLLFSDPNTSVLELNYDMDGEGYLRACFYLLAEEMGHRYMFLDQTLDKTLGSIDKAVGALVA